MKLKRKSKLKRRESLVGYVFVLPWIIGAIVFLLIPLVQSIYYSLCKVKITPKGMNLVFQGIKNYTEIFRVDVDFPLALLNYLLDTLLSVPVIVVFSLIIAMLLNSKIKGRMLFRIIYFLPVIIVSGPVMKQLADQGAATIPSMNVSAISNVLNQFLPYMIVEPITELFNNMIMVLWYSGVQILIFLAAIQKIDNNMYEAAKIDGGSAWECFWKITLPTIKPMMLLNGVYTVIFLSNNEQNEIINIIYARMFDINRGYGFASAMAWLYTIFILLLVGIVFLLLKPKKDNYDSAVKKEKKRVKSVEKQRAQLHRKQQQRAKIEKLKRRKKND